MLKCERREEDAVNTPAVYDAVAAIPGNQDIQEMTK
jgi:hypothetical protein